jgi:hypothetical protein
MVQHYSTFILDFMTVEFEHDSNIILEMLSHYKKMCGFNKEDDVFDLDKPISNAGWSFSKLFLAGGFVERLYQANTDDINHSRGKKFEEKFVSWLSTKLNGSECKAKIKIAIEMR